MAKLDTLTYRYKGKDYQVADIPDIFTHVPNRRIKIGPMSLNAVLYQNDKGYSDDEARRIDEEIYGFIDDAAFLGTLENFTEEVNRVLD